MRVAPNPQNVISIINGYPEFGQTRCQFHERFKSRFYSRRFQKRKKETDVLKAFRKHVDEIDSRSFQLTEYQ